MRMRRGLLGVLMLVMLFTTGIAAQSQKYLTGSLEFDQIITTGPQNLYALAGVEMSTTLYSQYPHIPVSSDTTAGRGRTYILGYFQNQCYEGYDWEGTCANDTPVNNGGTYLAGQQGTYDSGFYGYWSIKGEYYTWTGNPPSSLAGPRFSITATEWFGTPVQPPDPGDCGYDEYWDQDQERCIPTNCPIIIALGGDQNYKLTSEAEGVNFDINGDGKADHVAWTKADSEVAFLAYDANGNGTIDNGKELFGDSTVHGIGNGFAALASVANSHQGVLDNTNPFFAKLLLWTDRNHDGVSQPSELRPASDLLDGIGLGYGKSPRRDGNGNTYRLKGWALTKGVKPLKDYLAPDYHAHTINIYDVFLAVK